MVAKSRKRPTVQKPNGMIRFPNVNTNKRYGFQPWFQNGAKWISSIHKTKMGRTKHQLEQMGHKCGKWAGSPGSAQLQQHSRPTGVSRLDAHGFTSRPLCSSALLGPPVEGLECGYPFFLSIVVGKRVQGHYWKTQSMYTKLTLGACAACQAAPVSSELSWLSSVSRSA